MKTAAQLLLGETLDGGWKVIEHLDLRSLTSGGYFSEQYIVENSDGKRAFLKALDYDRLLKFASDPAAQMKLLTDSYLYERNLLHQCRDRRLDRVVVPLADGTIRVPGSGSGVVQYLILELGSGDLRIHAARAVQLDEVWTFRALHHVAVGLNQLHRLRIAHQDLKPSNVVVFEVGSSSGPSRVFKVGDLGRAASKDAPAPHETLAFAGDPTYAPPELLYRYLDPDWNRRRFGCDVYLFGSMIGFCFSGLGMTALIQQRLNPAHTWHQWRGAYPDVLPHVRDAFEGAIEDAVGSVRSELRGAVAQMIRELCEPDPSLRGDPQARAFTGTQYSLQKYITRLDRLCHDSELAIIGKGRGN